MRNPWKLTSFALAGALALSFVPAVGADPQPKMHDALDHLQNAERVLQNAAHDKGGHRVKALELTRAAITQVKAGIRYDNRN
jgi:Spy/CpxP family protein refolding chaperone